MLVFVNSQISKYRFVYSRGIEQLVIDRAASPPADVMLTSAVLVLNFSRILTEFVN